jgi:hypothetical protein
MLLPTNIDRSSGRTAVAKDAPAMPYAPLPASSQERSQLRRHRKSLIHSSILPTADHLSELASMCCVMTDNKSTFLPPPTIRD